MYAGSKKSIHLHKRITFTNLFGIRTRQMTVDMREINGRQKLRTQIFN